MSSRLSQLRSLLSQNSLDAVFISSLPNIIYLTGFSHFTDVEREAFLLITKNNNYILTDKRYTHAVQTHVKDFTLLEIFYGHRFEDWVKKIAGEEHIKSLGIEEDNITYHEYKKIAQHVPSVINLDMSTLRIIKSENEIQHLQKACEITDAAFLHILKVLKEGMTEQQVALELEIFMRKHSAVTAFPSIVAFEENAAFIHHQTGNRLLKRGDTVLIDMGAKYENYCADMSRTFFFGKATPEKKKAYQAVLDAQNKATNYIMSFLRKQESMDPRLREDDKHGLTGAEVDKIARDYIISLGYESFPHGLGHGIGLQVHEPPSLRPSSTVKLKPGMTFTNEPGIYLPHKFGIRIEDDFVIKNNKLIQLTKSLNNLIEIP